VDLHRHKVEGATSTPATTAKRLDNKLNAFIAVSVAHSKAEFNGNTISRTEAIKRAARRTGVSPATLRRRLKP